MTPAAGFLQGWQVYSSSVTYLLQLWTRLVSCAAYLKSGQPNLLADLLPQIISAYVQCRLDSVQLVAQVRRPSQHATYPPQLSLTLPGISQAAAFRRLCLQCVLYCMLPCPSPQLGCSVASPSLSASSCRPHLAVGLAAHALVTRV